MVFQLAGKGIGTHTVEGRGPTTLDGASGGQYLCLQVTVHQHGLQHAQLLTAVINLLGQGIDSGKEIRNGHGRLTNITGRAALGRCLAKLELTTVQFGHLGESFTQCIQAYHLCLHLTQAHSQGIDVLLGGTLGLLDLMALRFQFVAPGHGNLGRCLNCSGFTHLKAGEHSGRRDQNKEQHEDQSRLAMMEGKVTRTTETF